MNIWLVSNNSTLDSTIDNTVQLLGLILLFCFVLAVTYLTSRFVGQYKLGQVRNKNFKVIETMKVAPNKFLQMIKIGDKYVVISICKDTIHFITELSEDEVSLPEENGEHKIGFSDLFAKVQGKHKITKDLVEDNKTTKEE